MSVGGFRYLSPAMARVWSDTAKYRRWVDIERAVLQSQARTGLVPDEWAEAAAKTPPPAPGVVALAQISHDHEMVAFLAAWGVPHVHIGVTSSDIMDSGTALAIGEATWLVADAADICGEAVGRVAADRDWVWGRTHGVPAEQVPRGRLWQVGADRLAEAVAMVRLEARMVAGTCKIRGPVGNRDGFVYETGVLDRVGLSGDPDREVLQTADRTHWGRWVDGLVEVVGAAEWLATQVRLAAQPGTEWVYRPPARQVSSSSMPHKSNPALAERVCGLARVVRGLAAPLKETWASGWGYRDLTGSSVERICLPQISGYTERALLELLPALAGLEVAGEGTPPPGGSGTFHGQTAALLSGTPYLLYRNRLREEEQRDE